MLIRTQDKRRIINFEHIVQIYTENNCIYTNGCMAPLGKYNSEEEAIKVLDDMCEQYERSEKTDYVNIGYVGNTVFNMPPKEEK